MIMKLSVSDFYFLSSAYGVKAQTVEDAYEEMCIFMGQAVPMPCLLRAIRSLAAGGYITVEPEGNIISAITPITVTVRARGL